MQKVDISFLIIVRLDSIERIENTLIVTEFLNSNFQAPIFVLECAPFNNGLLEKLLAKNIQYTFLEDYDPILFRTRFLNKMTQSVETPYVAVWDTDIIVPVEQIIKSSLTHTF